MQNPIRKALLSEIEWINDRYKEVEFVPSHFENEVIAVAEVDGKKAGIGRLVRVDSENLELGGMYIFEKYRKMGLAKKIVEFLLKFASEEERVFCIPFSHLTKFYQSFGFMDAASVEVPAQIQEKYQWCKEKYPIETSLLYLVSSSSKPSCMISL